MLTAVLTFPAECWPSVLTGIELSIFVGVVVLFAIWPILFFARQVKKVLR